MSIFRAERTPGIRPANAALRTWTDRIRQSPSHRRFVLWTCLVGVFATTFTITILGVSLKSIAEDLDSDVATIAWVMTAPLLAQAVSAPLLGKLGDLFGHRRVYVTGFVLATAIAALTALAWDAFSLIGLRTAGQLMGTATMPASMAMLFRAYPGAQRVRAMGWMSVVIAGGPVIGLAIGGVLVEWIGWRPIFIVQAGLSALALVVASVVLVETPRRPSARLDVHGALALAAAAFALTFGMNRLPTWGLADPRVWSTLLAVPALLVLFGWIERRASEPLIPLELLGRRNFALPLLVGFTIQFAYMGGFLISPLIMMGIFGLGQAATSMWTIARPVSFSASSPVGGRLGMRFGERAMIIVGSVLVLAAMLAFTAGAASVSMIPIVAGLVLAGLGMGFAQPSLTTIVASAAAERDHGVAVSTMATTTGIGGVAGISILTAICADAAVPEAFRDGYALGAAVAAVGVLISFGLRTVEHRAEEPTAEHDRIELSTGLTERRA